MDSRLVKLSYKDQTLVLDLVGGGIAQYLTHGSKHCIFGYSSEDQKEAAYGDVLSPFPGRVEACKYKWKGVEYKLNTPLKIAGNAVHGFVNAEKWTITCDMSSQTHATAHATFTMEKKRFAALGFPFDLQFEIMYTLTDDNLKIRASVKNIGCEPAPFVPRRSRLPSVLYCSLQLFSSKNN
eukprot:TRINITY_DN6397_c0_g2_i1.p1 TRINITY_DN6397_c0_g2~~TRINITY_DN6397_c0_g2_i1.p1  ORF type:complete len:181 (+),score=5.75 TRINITY_DN6397_c0_g2_i1:120-662(+)